MNYLFYLSWTAMAIYGAYVLAERRKRRRENPRSAWPDKGDLPPDEDKGDRPSENVS